MRVLVFGDDLTGCNATAMLFRRMGWEAVTVLRHDRLPDLGRTGACIWNTESRLMPPAAAASRLRDMLTRLRDACARDDCESAFTHLQFAKRIDSTCRGPVAAEAEVLLQQLPQSSVAAVVAAFPSSGRTVEDGQLRVHGVPVDQTELARDPFTPLTTADVTALLRRQTALPVLRAAAAWLTPGANPVEACRQLRRDVSGRLFLVCDARTDADIARWAEFFADWPEPVLPVDPGPFTAALTAARRRRCGRVLVIGGSTMPTLSRQLDVLEAAFGVRLFDVDLSTIRESSAYSVGGVVRDLVTAAQRQAVFGVRTDRQPAAVRMAPGQVAAVLADIAREVLAQVPAASLYVSGGEVANEVLRCLDADTIAPLVEVEPLCILSEVAAGPWRGLRVVTKGGAVGSETVIVESVRLLLGSDGREAGMQR